MAPERGTAPYTRFYAGLLRLYPGPFRARFGEGMVQTFEDLCRERRAAGGGLLAFALWAFAETFAGIIRERMTMTPVPGRTIGRIALVTVFILLVPLVAMRFTDDVVWGPLDFLVAGALLFGAGLAYQLVARGARSRTYRIATGLAVAAALMLVWANLAVGVVGSEDNPANLMYFGVVAIGLVGAVLAHCRPRGMARALFATALAQALASVIALTVWTPQALTGPALVSVVGANLFFILLFVGSALLYRQAGAAVTERD